MTPIRQLFRVSTKLSALNYRRVFYESSIVQGVYGSPDLKSRSAVESFIRALNESERERLLRGLTDLQEEERLTKRLDGVSEPKPTFRQLRLVAFTSSIPFIGFGFLDNAIMIAAGEYIDVTLGAAFGLSTMAAAAFGNMISDVAGIGLAGYVEALAARLGMEGPTLTPNQYSMPETRFANHFGRAIGIVVGCIIGMFPLLFYDDEKPKIESMESNESSVTKETDESSVNYANSTKT